MARKPVKYDPQIGMETPKPEKLPFSTMEIYDQQKMIKRLWLDTFENPDYDDTLMWFTVEGIWEDIIQAGADFSVSNIMQTMMQFIARDDWAYELAYGKERVYPPEPPKKWPRYRRKRRKQCVGQLMLVI